MNGKYTFEKYTREDKENYRDILETMPYSDELNDFFVSEKRAAERRRSERRRRTDRYASACMAAGLLNVTDECAGLFPEIIAMRDMLAEAFSVLDEKIRRRLIAHVVAGRTYADIGAEEGVSGSSVQECVVRALAKLRKNLEMT